MKATFEKKVDYGRERYFPKDEVSTILTKFAHQICLSSDQMKILKDLGIELILIAPDLKI